MKTTTFFSVACTVLFFLVTQAVAGQTATMICTQKNSSNDVCEKYKLYVTLTSGEDTGKKGVFGIFAEADTQQFASWTSEDGWMPLTKNLLVRPVEKTVKELPLRKEYLVFEGSKERLCKLVNGKDFDLYGWHSVLSENELNGHRSFMKKFEITGLQAENFMYSIFLKTASDNHKIEMIYSMKCRGGKVK